MRILMKSIYFLLEEKSDLNFFFKFGLSLCKIINSFSFFVFKF